MNVHFTSANQFTHYSDLSVTIKGIEYSRNVIVTNDTVSEFKPAKIEQITFDDLTDILNSAPDLIIFGSGNKIVYPDIKILNALQNKGIGVEVMPIQALCRTFNF